MVFGTLWMRFACDALANGWTQTAMRMIEALGNCTWSLEGHGGGLGSEQVVAALEVFA